MSYVVFYSYVPVAGFVVFIFAFVYVYVSECICVCVCNFKLLLVLFSLVFSKEKGEKGHGGVWELGEGPTGVEK